MKKIFLIILSIAFYHADAQKLLLQKAQAFYTVSIPGMPMKDDNGNTINPKGITERFIFLETNYNGKPTIGAISYNGILFKAEVEEKETTANAIGIKKVNSKPVLLNRKKGNHTWKIYVYPANGQDMAGETIKKITIKGKLGKTPFSYVVTGETELTAPDRY